MMVRNDEIPKDPAMHRIGVLAIPPVTIFDLTIPELVFSSVEVAGQRAYDVLVATAAPGAVATTSSVQVLVDHDLAALEGVDTLIVTGSGTRDGFDPQVLETLRVAHQRGARMASICTGAFALAAAGILDDRPATTYWPYTEEFARRFPTVRLDAGVLYTDDTDVLTSAGVAAGLDLCLHIVRTDLGAAVANHVARLAVAAAVRHGGQQQFIESPLGSERGTWLSATRAWALAHLDEPLTVRDLALHAHMSERHLSRRFRAETGLSPLRWLLEQRIEHARQLLETTTLPLEQVAHRSGFGSGEALRQHFTKRFRVAPSHYRSSFGSPAGARVTQVRATSAARLLRTRRA